MKLKQRRQEQQINPRKAFYKKKIKRRQNQTDEDFKGN